MPEVSSQLQTAPNPTSFNWKGVIIAVAIGAILTGLWVLFYILLQPRLEPPSQSITPKPATPSSKPTPTRKVDLNDNFVMNEDDEVTISGTDLRIKVIEIKTPEEGAFDLPTYVTAKAIYKGMEEEITFTIGGNQPSELAAQRRQKDIFGFNMYVIKIIPNEVTFIVRAN
jgi:hypothetical protein